jgi:hypothetical protein
MTIDASTTSATLTDDNLRAWAESQGIQLTEHDQISQIRALRADMDANAQMRARSNQLLTDMSPNTRRNLASLFAKL